MRQSSLHQAKHCRVSDCHGPSFILVKLASFDVWDPAIELDEKSCETTPVEEAGSPGRNEMMSQILQSRFSVVDRPQRPQARFLAKHHLWSQPRLRASSTNAFRGVSDERLCGHLRRISGPAADGSETLWHLSNAAMRVGLSNRTWLTTISTSEEASSSLDNHGCDLHVRKQLKVNGSMTSTDWLVYLTLPGYSIRPMASRDAIRQAGLRADHKLRPVRGCEAS